MLPNMQPPMQPPTEQPVPEMGGGMDIEKQIMMLLQQAKKVAEKNGINFTELVSKVEGSTGSSAATKPPMPPAMP